MTNGKALKSICELHSKEVIFAAAIQAISMILDKPANVIVASAMSKDTRTVALSLMLEILDRKGIFLDSTITGKAV